MTERVKRVFDAELPLGKKFMTFDQVAELCHVQRQTVASWAKQGRIRVMRPGGSLTAGKKLTPTEDVMKLLECR